MAYQVSGEIRFLHRLVGALAKSGKREEAYHRYLELQKVSKDPLNPFIVYVENIHNDEDLEEFSSVILQYHTE